MSTTDKTVDGMTVEELRQGMRTFLSMTERLASPMSAADFERVARLVSSPDSEYLPDLGAMVDRALDERDRAREAAARLRRLDSASVTLAILEGRA